ncbi:MAG: hypothetical protein ACPGUV_08120, partial [Polyangiales bacterium]
VRDVLTRQGRRKMKSGLPQRILVRVVAFSGNRVIAARERRCLVVYDLWQDHYQIHRQDGRGTVTSRRNPRADAIANACLDFRALPLRLPRTTRPTRTLRFAIEASLNPLSTTQRRRIQQWLRGARPGAPQDGDSAAFFGGFVGRFVPADAHGADAQRRFVSQPVRRPR